MSKKMTAVEWLEGQLIKGSIYIGEELYDQAKAMEKEQIIEAYKADCEFFFSNETFSYYAEQYYKETYEQE